MNRLNLQLRQHPLVPIDHPGPLVPLGTTRREYVVRQVEPPYVSPWVGRLAWAAMGLLLGWMIWGQ